ncbi:MAG: hypothetical protein M3Y59_09980 [Myxococcota bacterium]|nr:hypothetical protein [Myxococcota bacterium]
MAGITAISGCAQGIRLPETGESAEYFVLGVPGGAVEARLSAEGISGADVQVTRFEDALRGRAYGATVDLYWTAEEVKGTVGGSPVDLKVIQEGNVLRIRGLYAGRTGNFSIQPGKIEGTLGGCSYGMESQMGGTYVGSMTCGGVPTRANLQLPPTLAMYYPAEIAAHLAVFLAR